MVGKGIPMSKSHRSVLSLGRLSGKSSSENASPVTHTFEILRSLHPLISTDESSFSSG